MSLPEQDAVGGSTDRPDPPLILRGLSTGLGEFNPERHGEFVSLWPGVEILPLYGLDDDGTPTSPEAPAAAILRYAPGASVPRHHHPGYEHILVLSGSQRDERATYGRGTCVVNPPGTDHSVTSDEGCLVLAIWTRSVEVLDGHGI